jgi:NAD-reducing hydrogenase small subunit
MSKIKLATVWLDGCSGCHMSLLDIDEALAVVVKKADIVYGPLVDAQEFPEGVDVTLVEGAISNQDDLKKIQIIRKRSRMVVALGDCAVTGNVPAMRNQIPVKQLLDRVYVEGASATPKAPGDPGVPPLLKRAIPVHEVVPVDLHVPGCPPSAASILYVVSELLEGRKPDLTAKVKFG